MANEAISRQDEHTNHWLLSDVDAKQQGATERGAARQQNSVRKEPKRKRGQAQDFTKQKNLDRTRDVRRTNSIVDQRTRGRR